MTADDPQGLVARSGLTLAEQQALEQLAALCNAADGLDLKLNLDAAPPAAVPGPTRFLYYAGGALAGFCSLDGGMEMELCGMVHPAQRRQGLGRRLLQAARAACNRRGVVELLLIVEAASPSGQAFVAAAGGRYVFGEHHMERDLLVPLPGDGALGAAPPNGAPPLEITPAGPAELDTLARITAAAFGDPVDVVRQRIAEDLGHGAARYYLARQGPAPRGSLKLVGQGTRAGIYAFGVLPDYRGRGFGRQILTQTLALLRAEGWTRAALEVETANAPAIALYRRCGFQPTTTYGYYALPLEDGVTSDE